MSPADGCALAQLLTLARHRRGWSLIRLSVESGVPYVTLKRLHRGRLSLANTLKLTQALDIAFALPPAPLTAHEAQHGR